MLAILFIVHLNPLCAGALDELWCSGGWRSPVPWMQIWMRMLAWTVCVRFPIRSCLHAVSIYILPLPIQERSCWSGVSAAFTHFDSNKFQQFFLCKFMDFWFQQISTVLNFMDFWFQQISTVFVRKFMDFLLWFRFLICHRQPSSRKRMESRTHECHHLNAPQSKIVQVYSFKSIPISWKDGEGKSLEATWLWIRLLHITCYI